MNTEAVLSTTCIQMMLQTVQFQALLAKQNLRSRTANDMRAKAAAVIPNGWDKNSYLMALTRWS